MKPEKFKVIDETGKAKPLPAPPAKMVRRLSWFHREREANFLILVDMLNDCHYEAYTQKMAEGLMPEGDRLKKAQNYLYKMSGHANSNIDKWIPISNAQAFDELLPSVRAKVDAMFPAMEWIREVPLRSV